MRASDHDTAAAGRSPRTPLPSAARREDGPRGDLLALQRTAGNAALTAALREGGHAVQRAAGPAVQRAPLSHGNFQFTNLAQTNPQYRDKAIRVLDLLGRHTTIRNYVGTRTCRITLEKRTTETPADVVDRGAEGVSVTLAAYYFENYDIGYLTGMLAHEFAVHPLASARGIAHEEAGFHGLPFPVPGLENEDRQGGPPMMNTQGAKQADHILAVIPNGPRYEIYRDVTLEMAELLVEDVHQQEEGASEQDVTDLLDCFLMDVATMAATNDQRLRAAPMTWGGGAVRADVAKVYHAYKERLSAVLAADSPIRPLMPKNKDADAVYTDFATLARRIAAGVLGARSIQN
ncbi:hypothetical protein ACWQ06_22695 [Streptomyces angustmyceticus]